MDIARSQPASSHAWGPSVGGRSTRPRPQMRALSSSSPRRLIELGCAGVMLTRTRWVMAGGAAALVITRVVAVYGSPTADADPEQRGLVIDAEAANRARAERVAPTAAPAAPAAPTASATPTASA